jgi:hypothetical protein
MHYIDPGFISYKLSLDASRLEELMRAGVLAVALVLIGSADALAAERLTANEIKATFFNGQPFTATAASNAKFKMTYTPDGKVTREPLGKIGARGEGTWKLDKFGFCTIWTGQKALCSTVVPTGDKKWSVVRGTTTVATWSK